MGAAGSDLSGPLRLAPLDLPDWRPLSSALGFSRRTVRREYPYRLPFGASLTVPLRWGPRLCQLQPPHG